MSLTPSFAWNTSWVNILICFSHQGFSFLNCACGCNWIVSKIHDLLLKCPCYRFCLMESLKALNHTHHSQKLVNVYTLFTNSTNNEILQVWLHELMIQYKWVYVHIIMYSQICFFKVLIKGTYYRVLVIWSAGILGLKSSVESWSTYTCRHVKTLTRTIFIAKGLYDCLYSKQWILYTKIESVMCMIM